MTVTLIIATEDIPAPRLGALDAPTPQLVPASMPWHTLPYDTVLVSGSMTVQLPFYPGITDDRIEWAEFRLYRFDRGADLFDPADDSVQLAATTEGGTPSLDIDPIRKVAVTNANASIAGLGIFQLFMVPKDTDGDRLPDDWEMAHVGNLSHAAATNTDGDTLTAIQEYQYGTNPLAADTDGDGYNDPETGYDPCDARSANRDDDGDTLGDQWEIKWFGNTTSQTGTGNPDGDAYNKCP